MRIERLWVDVTAQVGSTWGAHFTSLELQHGLDINSRSHIWLLHYLFLPIINSQLEFFIQAWNQLRLQIRDGPNRSPADMFGFDMLVHGIRGHQLIDDINLSPDELEVYGIDWEALRDDRLLSSRQENNPHYEDGSSWLQVGPPANMNEVTVEIPIGPLSVDQAHYLDSQLALLSEDMSDSGILIRWNTALAICCSLHPNDF